LGLPLNQAKELVGAYRASLQGGLFDGKAGVFEHHPEKSADLLWKGMALLSQKTWTRHAVQHWAGKACFAAAFRRPLLSVLNAVFGEALAMTEAFVASVEAKEEVLLFVILLPLAGTNLRSTLSSTIACTDASESGGGACESGAFKTQLLSSSMQPSSDLCEVCKKPGTALSHPCPARCGSHLDSLDCVFNHRGFFCPRRLVPRPLFAERFSGRRGLLTNAVSMSGVAVQEPFGLPFHDFFTEQSKATLADWETRAEVMWEWHSPPATTMLGNDQCWGLTRSGQGVPLRTSHTPTGTSRSHQYLLRRDNKTWTYSVLRCQALHGSDRFFCLEHPSSSFGWRTPEAQQLLRTDGVMASEFNMCCFGSSYRRRTRIVHNSRKLKDLFEGLHCCCVPSLRDDPTALGEIMVAPSSEAEYPRDFCLVVARRICEELEEWFPLLDVEKKGRALITADLANATNRFQGEVLTAATDSVWQMEVAMVAGQERHHLRELIRSCRYRGTDVWLSLDGSTTDDFPYPAYVWQWRTVMSYPWRSATCHINELELSAFLNYIRFRIQQGDLASRLVVVLDSKVAIAIISRGRSSSLRLNRVARRLCALCCVSDVYPHALWTVSGWNFADIPSRAWDT